SRSRTSASGNLRTPRLTSNPSLMKSTSALLLTSTQRDLLHPTGGAWALVGGTVQKNNVVANLVRLVTAAREAGWPVLHSPIEINYVAMKDYSPPTAIHQ